MDEIKSSRLSNTNNFPIELIFEAEKMYEKYMKWNRWLLQGIGLWPKQSDWTIIISLFYDANIFVQISCLILSITAEICSVWNSWNNFVEVIEIISGTISGILILQRALIMLFKRSKIQEVDNILRKLWIDGWCEHNESVHQKMLKTASISKIITLSYFVFIAIAVIDFMIAPIISLQKQRAANVPDEDFKYSLPYMAYVPGVDMSNLMNYVFFYIAISFSGFSKGLGGGASDTFYTAYISQICLQFDLLGIEFYNIINIKDSNKFKSFDRAEILKRQKFEFKKSLLKHQQLIRLSEIMQEIFSEILLGLCFVGTIAICGAMFQTTVAVQHGNIVQFAQYSILVMTEIFIYCWFGDALINKSTLLYQAIYFTEWYNIDKNLAQDLMTVMIRAQRPIYMNASGFVVISLELCTTIWRTTASYYALLRNMYFA